MLDAWLNLSHRENAREFVIVRASAMAIITKEVSFRPSLSSSPSPTTGWAPCAQLTNKRQPDEHEAHERQYSQRDPQQRLDIVGQPEEAAIGGVDDLGAGLAALKHPLGVARGRVDLVPPAQPDEPAAGDVFQVVEVAREEEDGDDEDEDAVVSCAPALATAPPAKVRLVRGRGWEGRQGSQGVQVFGEEEAEEVN